MKYSLNSPGIRRAGTYRTSFVVRFSDVKEKGPQEAKEKKKEQGKGEERKEKEGEKTTEKPKSTGASSYSYKV
jgi:hypothetical protein